MRDDLLGLVDAVLSTREGAGRLLAFSIRGPDTRSDGSSQYSGSHKVSLSPVVC
jgi:hypothetical protein